MLAIWVGAGIVLGFENLTKRKKQVSVPEQRPLLLGAILLLAIWLAATVWLWKVGAIKWIWSTYEVAMYLKGAEEFGIPPQLWQAFLLSLVAMGTLVLTFAMGLLGRQKDVPLSRAIIQGIWRWSLPMLAAISLLYAANLILTAIWEIRIYLPI